MTNEQERNLYDFEALVRRLMKAYEKERASNVALRQMLDESQQKLGQAEEAIERLKLDYSQLKTARMLEVSGDDVKESKARIAKLIREVDKCIALLDV